MTAKRRLTAGQRQVLELLAAAGRNGLPTGMHTSNGRVSGMTVTSLENRGLASRAADRNTAYITGAGRDLVAP